MTASSGHNVGSVTGILKAITPYESKKNKLAMNRLDVLVPSPSPLEHPTTVSVHSARAGHAASLNKEITVSYKAMTFLKSGSGAGADLVFDQTRLEEV